MAHPSERGRTPLDSTVGGGTRAAPLGGVVALVMVVAVWGAADGCDRASLHPRRASRPVPDLVAQLAVTTARLGLWPEKGRQPPPRGFAHPLGGQAKEGGPPTLGHDRSLCLASAPSGNRTAPGTPGARRSFGSRRSPRSRGIAATGPSTPRPSIRVQGVGLELSSAPSMNVRRSVNELVHGLVHRLIHSGPKLVDERSPSGRDWWTSRLWQTAGDGNVGLARRG